MQTEHTPTPTDTAPNKWAAWLRDAGLSPERAARKLKEDGYDVTGVRLRQLCAGFGGAQWRHPAFPLMAAIYRLTDGAITPNDWADPTDFPGLHDKPLAGSAGLGRGPLRDLTFPAIEHHMARDIDDDAPGAPEPETAEKLPDSIAIGRALSSIAAAKIDAADRNGMLKADLESAKKDGVNLKAVKIVAQIEGIKKPQDREAVAAHLMLYLEKRGFASQPDLFGHNSGDTP